MKKIIITLLAISFIGSNTLLSFPIETNNTENLTAFDWKPISDVDKILTFVKEKDITKRTKDQTKRGNIHYNNAIDLMNKNEYASALNEFKAAMKRYKRAKLNDDALNYIRVNMALCHANLGTKEARAESDRLLKITTSKIYNDLNWSYNIAIAKYFTEDPKNQLEATKLLSNIIRKNQFYFQAYVTLEGIYRKSGNDEDADKVLDRLETAKNKLIENKEKKNKKEKTTKDKESKKIVVLPKGIKPDVSNLKIVTNNNLLEFNKIEKIEDKEMDKVQEGIAEYTLGVNALENRSFKAAQTHLKNTEKKIKRVVPADGLSYVRGNLAIAYLATGQKRGAGQAKRYIRNLTSKIYKTHRWTYNLAVAYYAYTDLTVRIDRRTGKRKESLTVKEYTKEAIKLFNSSIKKDKLYLPAYQNLIYIYREQNEEKKAQKIYEDYIKARNKLVTSFSKEEQIEQGNQPCLFRVNLGVFGEFDTPVSLFEKQNVVAIPIDEKRTAYVTGIFYQLEEARLYEEKLKEQGYTKANIIAFKCEEMEELEEF